MKCQVTIRKAERGFIAYITIASSYHTDGFKEEEWVFESMEMLLDKVREILTTEFI